MIAGAYLGPLEEVYSGLWGYNSLLCAGGVIYFLQPSLAVLPLLVIAPIMGAVLQAAIMPSFIAVREINSTFSEYYIFIE